MRNTAAAVLCLLLYLSCSPLLAFDWVPTDEEINKYRKSWNPFSEGPLLLQSVDIHPKGQLSIRPFVFSQIGEHSFNNRLSFVTDRQNGPVHLYAVSPLVTLAYGLTNHVELGASANLNAFWANTSNGSTNDAGLGDVSLIMKYRPIIQDPDSRRPSLTLYTQLVLPTSRWAGTERPPGGFAPLGRLPATRFGELGLTEGLTFRKNFTPFRISGGVFYTYAAPGDNNGQTTYTGDVVNTRLILEHFLDDEKGLAYNLELVTVHTLTFRADGHSLNRGQVNGSTVIGIEPALQWRFSDAWVGAAGVLFTVAGQNQIEAFYPNFSIQWYYNRGKKVIMR